MKMPALCIMIKVSISLHNKNIYNDNIEHNLSK